ncbi:molybdenum cofactor guanylyltransferase [Carboxydothermus ferrireducens]|uniref:Probable molybdenum cofactor guanylyltransferase n=1 Tax=Carboxydothermus ferrireducens DSM 11255 TaxID=1119529 RepID=A0ABX2RA65_9THEO|nr:molybdenum cofactor guanylyltransferase [Carboxydothermus ferrireducens]NYE56770.1 molybdopterin-guanine dinucleotide biosynthesis protein A [Carboxydothermus ferrireducens DSM 11255]
MQILTVAILAGGKSSRMGQNKALLPLGTMKIIEHLVTNLRPIASELLLVANTDEYAFLNLPVYRDRFPGQGPLAGIETALRVAVNEKVYITACDLPLLPAEIPRFLAENTEDYDVTVLAYKGKIEPLIGIYRKSIYPVVEKHLILRKNKIIDFYPQVKVKIIHFEQLPENLQREEFLLNVNTPADYEKLLKIFSLKE